MTCCLAKNKDVPTQLLQVLQQLVFIILYNSEGVTSGIARQINNKDNKKKMPFMHALIHISILHNIFAVLIFAAKP